MNISSRFSSLLFGLVCLFLLTFCTQPTTEDSPEALTVELAPEVAAQLASDIRNEVAAVVADGLKLSLWASDTLLADPIALSMDEQGERLYFPDPKTKEFGVRYSRAYGLGTLKPLPFRLSRTEENFYTRNSHQRTARKTNGSPTST